MDKEKVMRLLQEIIKEVEIEPQRESISLLSASGFAIKECRRIFGDKVYRVDECFRTDGCNDFEITISYYEINNKYYIVKLFVDCFNGKTKIVNTLEVLR